MRESRNGARVPGARLLTIARLVFNERLLSAVVEPTIADLQCEVAQAGASRVKRLRAQWRGYSAFWMLILVAPFAPWAEPDATASPDVVVRLAVGSTVVLFLAMGGLVFGAWVAGMIVAAAPVAIVMHAWYRRHPSDLPAPREPEWRSPQINFSSTQVAGNTGGLIFVVGSVCIVALGLPSIFWFLLGGTGAGCVLAWGLAAWHTSHPRWGQPENGISCR